MRRPELPPESLAGIVLAHPVRPERPRWLAPILDTEGPAGIILGQKRTRARALALGTSMSLLVALAGVLSLGSGRAGGAPPAPAPRARPAIRIDSIVALNAAPPPPTVAEPARRSERSPGAPRGAKPAPQAAAPSRPAPPSAVPPPPAQAGQVVAAAEPVDLTGFDIASGQGARYAGGVTASSGTNTTAVQSDTVDRGSKPDQPQGGSSRARAVGLPAGDWRCPWPPEATASGLTEVVATIRVAVRANGSVESAELVSDPGHGFGPVALACARARRFAPARDAAGEPVAALSPPIRVRFTQAKPHAAL